MIDWQVPVYEGLGLVAVRLLGIVNILLEISYFKDVPVNLVQIFQRSVELCGPQSPYCKSGTPEGAHWRGNC